jgi:cysteine-rich repeat protein
MEQCDDGNTRDGDGCSARCTQESPTERCRAIWEPDDADCASCTCDACAEPTLNCLLAADERTRTLCTETIACATRTGCVGVACYCGSAGPTDCLLPGAANGPCRAEIERAAGTNVPPDVLAASSSPTTPLGLSWSQRNCIDMRCPNLCGR